MSGNANDDTGGDQHHKPAIDDVLANMMADLGNDRLEELAYDPPGRNAGGHFPRNGYVSANSVHAPSRPVLATGGRGRLNDDGAKRWQAATGDGTFFDDDYHKVKDLDPMANGRLHDSEGQYDGHNGRFPDQIKVPKIRIYNPAYPSIRGRKPESNTGVSKLGIALEHGHQIKSWTNSRLVTDQGSGNGSGSLGASAARNAHAGRDPPSGPRRTVGNNARSFTPPHKRVERPGKPTSAASNHSQANKDMKIGPQTTHDSQTQHGQLLMSSPRGANKPAVSKAGASDISSTNSGKNVFSQTAVVVLALKFGQQMDKAGYVTLYEYTARSVCVYELRIGKDIKNRQDVRFLLSAVAEGTSKVKLRWDLDQDDIGYNYLRFENVRTASMFCEEISRLKEVFKNGSNSRSEASTPGTAAEQPAETVTSTKSEAGNDSRRAEQTGIVPIVGPEKATDIIEPTEEPASSLVQPPADAPSMSGCLIDLDDIGEVDSFGQSSQSSTAYCEDHDLAGLMLIPADVGYITAPSNSATPALQDTSDGILQPISDSPEVTETSQSLTDTGVEAGMHGSELVADSSDAHPMLSKVIDNDNTTIESAEASDDSDKESDVHANDKTTGSKPNLMPVAQVQYNGDKLPIVEEIEAIHLGQNLSQDSLRLLGNVSSIGYDRLIESSSYMAKALELYHSAVPNPTKRATLECVWVHLRRLQEFDSLSYEQQNKVLAVVYANTLYCIEHSDSRIVRSSDSILRLRSTNMGCPQGVREYNRYMRAQRRTMLPAAQLSIHSSSLRTNGTSSRRSTDTRSSQEHPSTPNIQPTTGASEVQPSQSTASVTVSAPSPPQGASMSTLADESDHSAASESEIYEPKTSKWDVDEIEEADKSAAKKPASPSEYVTSTSPVATQAQPTSSFVPRSDTTEKGLAASRWNTAPKTEVDKLDSGVKDSTDQSQAPTPSGEEHNNASDSPDSTDSSEPPKSEISQLAGKMAAFSWYSR